MFDLSAQIGRRVADRTSRGEVLPFYLKALHWIASWTVYRPLLDRIGCLKIRSAFTGGHPISPDVIGFFRAIGLNLKQCYG